MEPWINSNRRNNVIQNCFIHTKMQKHKASATLPLPEKTSIYKRALIDTPIFGSCFFFIAEFAEVAILQ